MIGAIADVAAAALATAIVMVVPGVAALGAVPATRVIPGVLHPAAAVTATVLVAAPCLVLTMALHRSIVTFAVLLAAVTVALAFVALVRAGRRDRAHARAGSTWHPRSIVAWTIPTTLLVALATVDAPQVRSDTYWHVALARKLADIDQLSSASIAFGAGTPANSSYPLPVWHALIAVAERMPHVDVWYASWFMTLWLAPVAMVAFGGMAAALVGRRHAALAGAWTFLAVVVLGYGPWFFASRYLGYPGQVAIFVVLPIIVWAFVRRLEAADADRRALLVSMLAATAAVGVLHANYGLYPALFTLGGATLLFVGARERAGSAMRSALMVVGVSAATLAAQLPWIMHDANFLRGDTPPGVSPSAFIRHRDVLTGSEDWFWLKLGSLAAQPWLVVGALAIPLLLALRHRRVGPWVLAGGAFAIVVTARVPWIVHLVDSAGSITPVTRFDRVYPAAVGVLGVALLLACALQRLPGGRAIRTATVGAALAACVVGTWWVDSIRDTRRIVVTPFVEARWVGGLDPMGLPLVAVWVSSVLVLLVAVGVRLRVRERWTVRGPSSGAPRMTWLAAAFAGAIVVGLVPASVERTRAVFEPQAFDRAARHDREFVRIEVYPAPVRREVLRLRQDAVVFADVVNVRRVASLVPVQVVGESIIRELELEPVTSVRDAAATLDEPKESVPPADVLVVDRTNSAFAAFVAAAEACGWTDRSAGGVRIFVRDDDRCQLRGT